MASINHVNPDRDEQGEQRKRDKFEQEFRERRLEDRRYDDHQEEVGEADQNFQNFDVRQHLAAPPLCGKYPCR
jgi:hypothetical protein